MIKIKYIQRHSREMLREYPITRKKPVFGNERRFAVFLGDFSFIRGGSHEVYSLARVHFDYLILVISRERIEFQVFHYL